MKIFVFSLAAATLLSAGTSCGDNFSAVDYIRYQGQCLEITKEMSGEIESLIKKHGSQTAKTSTAYDASKAGQLYEQCIACHGATGQRRAIGKSDKIHGWGEKKILDSLTSYQQGSEDRHGMGKVMTAQLGALSHDDLKQLARYISEL